MRLPWTLYGRAFNGNLIADVGRAFADGSKWDRFAVKDLFSRAIQKIYGVMEQFTLASAKGGRGICGIVAAIKVSMCDSNQRELEDGNHQQQRKQQE